LPHRDDRRRVSIGLTKKGERLIEELFPIFNQHERAAVHVLSAAEQRELARLLRKVTYNVTMNEASSD
jgi:DNA-binding MarR family transcriptional regulator